MDRSHAAGVRWDLSDLYPSAEDPSLIRDLEQALRRAEEFERKYRGTIAIPGGPAPAHVAAAVAELEAIGELAEKPACFAQLLHAGDAQPPLHGALVARTQEAATEIRKHLLFFELEWLALSEEEARPVIESKECERHRHFLHALRRYKPHVLSEAEEKILALKANTGARAFERLFDDLLSTTAFEVDVDGRTQELTESEVIALLHSPDREVRRAAARSLTAGLEKNGRVWTAIFNALALDHAIDDRLRSYADPMQARHLANEIDAGIVEALIRACEAATGMVREYYEMKRRVLGLDLLFDFDRYAPVGPPAPPIPWEQCQAIVLESFGEFSPRMAEIAGQFFAHPWIDAEVRKGKCGGAFSAAAVPSVHPYVLVNYTGQPRDVMTVAHELGHAVHQYLARPRGYLQFHAPLPLAETASVFGEMLVFDRLLRAEPDSARRFALLCQKIEDGFGTVFRQIALTRFEQALHRARREEGELSSGRIGELWMAANESMYGGSVVLTEGYAWWWAHVPHFVHAPFYCYAYGLGELLVLALYEKYRQAGRAFEAQYLDLLAAGGSESPEALLQRLGVSLADPGLWGHGLALLRRLVDMAIDLASGSRGSGNQLEPSAERSGPGNGARNEAASRG